MPPNWDQFEDIVQDAHTDTFGGFQSADIINYSGGYDHTTGETDDWTEDAPVTVDMELTTPNTPIVVTDASGQESEVSRRGRIRSDAPADDDTTSVTIHPIGTEHQKPTEVQADGQRYIVAEQYDEGNGLYQLLLVED